MNSQQLGKFSISEDLVRNNPEIVAEAFKAMRLVPVRVETHFYGKEIEYIGISEQFDKVKKGMIVPPYLVHIFSNKSKNGPEEYSHVEVTPL